MITKKDLIAALQKLIIDEEGVITFYVNFSRVLLKYTENLDNNRKEKIEDGFRVLYNDSLRHRKTLESRIRKIREGSKNEY